MEAFSYFAVFIVGFAFGALYRELRPLSSSDSGAAR